MTAAVLENELSPRAHHLPAVGAVLVTTALLAGLPALGQQAGLLVAVGAVQVALVAAWVVATGIRGFLGSLALGLAAAAGADAALLLPGRARLDSLLVVLGLAFLAAVVHQMVRPAPRRYLVASLAGVVLLICSVCALSVLLTVGRLDGGLELATTAVLVVGGALVVGHLVDLVLPRPQIAHGVPRGLLGVVLAVLAGIGIAVLRQGAGSLLDALTAIASGTVLGAVAALTGLGASYVVSERAQRRWALAVVQAVLPLAAAAPAAYALALYAGT
ncbi:MAG: conserved rane protein of unknown function [Modestobacter sp.]|nr:conserved rane protein of unknown function [Modestobacter sp.]